MNENLEQPENPILIEINKIKIAGETRPVSEEKVSELVASLKNEKLHHAIHVKLAADGEFILLAGRHRLEALKKLNRSVIPAVILEGDEAEVWRWSENIYRHNADALSKSIAIVKLAQALNLPKVEEEKPRGGIQRDDKGFSKLAKATGFSRTRIANAHLHFGLVPFIRNLVYENPKVNNVTMLNRLASMKDKRDQVSFIKKQSGKSRVSVRAAEEEKRQVKARLDEADAGRLAFLKEAWKKCDFRKKFRKENKKVREVFLRKMLQFNQ